MPEQIPKKIHFIWIGGPILKKYLESILKLLYILKPKNFEVNIPFINMTIILENT